eukprot:COSAG05_NODE_2786_length_2637_cov_6.436769_2_plen_280_part_00
MRFNAPRPHSCQAACYQADAELSSSCFLFAAVSVQVLVVRPSPRYVLSSRRQHHPAIRQRCIGVLVSHGRLELTWCKCVEPKSDIRALPLRDLFSQLWLTLQWAGAAPSFARFLVYGAAPRAGNSHSVVAIRGAILAAARWARVVITAPPHQPAPALASPYSGEDASTSPSDTDDDDDDHDLTQGDMPDAATIDRSGNAAANRLEAVIARIARREGDPHERRERARRIRSDILLARRIRGGPAPALPQAWGGVSRLTRPRLRPEHESLAKSYFAPLTLT